MINAAEPYAPLDLQTNPFRFDPNAPPSLAQTALKEVIGHIRLGRRVIIVAGGAGTDKTSLMKMIARSCSDMGFSVCRFDRGDLADTTIDARSDVVLVDDADSIPDSAVLTLFFPNPSNTATTWVFACLPSSVDHFSCLDASVVELAGRSIDDARTYLLERATSIGRPNLFAPDALDLIVHQAHGSPRLLLSMASLAFFAAGWGRAAQIAVRHVPSWSESQRSLWFVEDSAAPHEGVFRGESVNHIKAKHRSASEQDAYRSVSARVRGGSTVTEYLPKPFPLDRARPLMGTTAPIAASLGLAGAIAAFLIGGNDASVGTDLAAPIVANPVVAEASPVETLAAAPVSPGLHASAGGDAAEPASVNTPAGKATAALDDRDPIQVLQSRAAPKRTGPPAIIKTARLARAPKSAGSPAATNEAAQRAGVVHGARQVVARRTVEAAFHAQHAARQANEAARQAERTVEGALHAQHAARQANGAARQADLAARRAEQAARRAEQAASQAERAARLANRGFRLQFPWNAITKPRSTS
jgi:hypothetical protein